MFRFEKDKENLDLIDYYFQDSRLLSPLEDGLNALLSIEVRPPPFRKLMKKN